MLKQIEKNGKKMIVIKRSMFASGLTTNSEQE